MTPTACGSCSFATPAHDQFCQQCGKPLTPEFAPGPPPSTTDPGPTAGPPPYAASTGKHPQQAPYVAPVWQPIPAARDTPTRSPHGRTLVVAVFAGVVLLVLGVAAGLLLGEQQPGQPPARSSASGNQTDEQDNDRLVSPPSTLDPSAPTEDTIEVQDPDLRRDDLGLDVAQVNQSCSGDFVVILASSGEPKSYRATLAPALASSGAARYLVTTESCGSFNQYVDGNPIYAAYAGPYASLTEACERRAEGGYPGAYIRQLDAASEGRFMCSCNQPPEVLPDLGRDNAESADVPTAYVVADVQNLLSRAGFNPDRLVGGHYGPQTTRWIRRLQRREYLSTTGRTDLETWDVLLQFCT